MNSEAHLTEEQRRAVDEFRQRHRTGMLALLFTDVVGSTGLKQRLGDAAGSELIKRQHALVREALSSFEQAEEISTAGDSFFLVFVKPSDAVRFALQLQHALRELAKRTSAPIQLRIGIHVGEVFIEERGGGALERDVLGVQVDTAARIMALAVGGQILMSRPVFDNARTILRGETLPGVDELLWINHGPYLFKGLDEPLDICEVGEAGQAPLAPPPETDMGKPATLAGAEQVLGWRPALEQVVPNTQWELEKKLGEGGFGEVWLARHRRTKELRVFKFCFRADRLRNLKREMTIFRILKEELGARPDIARLVEVQFDSVPYYLASEYTAGGDLQEWVEERGGFDNVPMALRLEIAAQIANALGAAHSAGVIHKDIKPSNVLVEELKDGTVQVSLTDFGIGQLADRRILERAGFTATGFTETISSPSETYSRSGTRQYVAPEILEGKAPTAQADIYALGVLLYQLLCGDFSTVLAPGWERDIDDPILREDIAACVDHLPERRIQNAGELAERLRSVEERRAERQAQVQSDNRRKRRRRLLAVAPIAVAILGLCALAAWLYLEYRNTQREKTIQEIARFVDQREFLDAFLLAQPIADHVPDDLWSQMTRTISVSTRPPGALLSYKDWSNLDTPWNTLGRTPLNGVRFPHGVYRWRAEKDGYVTVEVVPNLERYDRFSLTLHEEGSSVSQMAEIGATTLSLRLGHVEGASVPDAPAYLIDRYEVTNARYKEFVDSGGYRIPDYWRHPFLSDDGTTLPWDQAMAQFTDTTGRPGPATWRDGTYPEGRADYPVAGVSWYEAAAYAAFAGKSLPTTYHWANAGATRLSGVIVPHSNLESTAPAAVGVHPGVGWSGLYDMGGNVKEWCYNATDASGTRRYILGGAWFEPTYAFNMGDFRPAMDRRNSYGFRCALYPAGMNSLPPRLLEPVALREAVDWTRREPVPDDEFRYLRRFHDYTKTEIEPEAREVVEESRSRVMERIVFDAVYEGPKMVAYLFIPKGVEPPYQTVIFFPGTGAFQNRSIEDLDQPVFVDLLLKSGRAVMYPVYRGSYERWLPDGLPWNDPNRFRQWVGHMSKDFRRSIDYLETRDDISTDTLAYFGFSFGGVVGPIFLALEPQRIQCAIIVAGGLPRRSPPDEVNPFQYASRVEVPVLMLNGKEDVAFPYETCQKPLFDTLGTSDSLKQHITYPGGHALFAEFGKAIRGNVESWLNDYQGPVHRKKP